MLCNLHRGGIILTLDRVFFNLRRDDVRRRNVSANDPRRTDAGALTEYLRHSHGGGIARPKWDPNGQCLPVPSRAAAAAARAAEVAAAPEGVPKPPLFEQFCPQGRPVVEYTPELQEVRAGACRLLFYCTGHVAWRPACRGTGVERLVASIRCWPVQLGLYPHSRG